MATYTAATLLSTNGLTTTDITAEDTERIADAALDHIAVRANIGITHMTGTAGSKTLTIPDDINAAFFPLIACMLREGKKTALTNSDSTGNSSGSSSSIGVGSINVSESSSVSSAISASASINNAQNTIYREMFEQAIRKLREIDVSYG